MTPINVSSWITLEEVRERSGGKAEWWKSEGLNEEIYFCTYEFCGCRDANTQHLLWRFSTLSVDQ
jgi:hypothetical protein